MTKTDISLNKSRTIAKDPVPPAWEGQNWSLTDKGFDIFKSVSKDDISIDVDLTHSPKNSEKQSDSGHASLGSLSVSSEYYPDLLQVVSSFLFNFLVIRINFLDNLNID